MDGSEIKLVIFADDMTSFVGDKLSHRTLFDTIDLFSAYSGLKVNHDKTEILLLGNMEVNSSELGVHELINSFPAPDEFTGRFRPVTQFFLEIGVTFKVSW